MSEINITIEGGTSKRLLTAGKFCDRDIVVTAEGGGGYVYEGSTAIVMEGFFKNDKYLVGFMPTYLNTMSVYNEAFRNCQILKSAIFKGSVRIYDYAFAQCHALEFVKGPSDIFVAGNAFENCSALKRIDGIVSLMKATPTNNSAERAFANCRALESIRLQCTGTQTSEYIYSQAFLNCENLTDVTFNTEPETIIIIDDNAFSGCKKLPMIDIPECKSIGEYAFNGCTNLHSVVLRSTTHVCNVALNALDDTPMLTGTGHVYVPTTMYEYYREGYEETLNTLMPGFFGILFRKIEDYTVDGTVTGDLDPDKI